MERGRFNKLVRSLGFDALTKLVDANSIIKTIEVLVAPDTMPGDLQRRWDQVKARVSHAAINPKALAAVHDELTDIAADVVNAFQVEIALKASRPRRGTEAFAKLNNLGGG